MKINVYLNELSLEIGSPEEWKARFDNAFLCLKTLSKINTPLESVTTIIHPQIFLNIVIHPDLKFTEFLNKDRERKLLFTSVYKTAVKEFLFTLPESKYFINKIDVSNSSVADSYESQKSGAFTILINFSSVFPYPTVDIKKENEGSQTVLSYHGVHELTAKLIELKLIKTYYDKSSNTRPNETLTILSDTSLFMPTKYGNRKNRLYRRIGHEDELWCLDRFHRGNSIHLEVFSKSQKKQIAVSCHDEINFFRELTKDEKNRVLIMTPM